MTPPHRGTDRVSGHGTGVTTAAMVNGARLAYTESGSGPAVVLLHAGIADSRMWHRQLTDLAGDYRVVGYDLRGYGESQLPAHPYAHHDDLAGVLDALGVDRAVVVGCSLGGAVAVDSALAYPDRVRALVLVGSGLSGYEWSAQFRELWHSTVDPAGDDLDAVAEAEVRMWVVGPGRTPDAVDPEVLRLATSMDRHALVCEERLDTVEEVPLAPPAAERLNELAVPTLVITGTADVPEMHAIADRLVGGIAGVRQVDLPDAAHLAPLEQPDAFNRAVRGFLQTI